MVNAWILVSIIIALGAAIGFWLVLRRRAPIPLHSRSHRTSPQPLEPDTTEAGRHGRRINESNSLTVPPETAVDAHDYHNTFDDVPVPTKSESPPNSLESFGNVSSSEMIGAIQLHHEEHAEDVAAASPIDGDHVLVVRTSHPETSEAAEIRNAVPAGATQPGQAQGGEQQVKQGPMGKETEAGSGDTDPVLADDGRGTPSLEEPVTEEPEEPGANNNTVPVNRTQPFPRHPPKYQPSIRTAQATKRARRARQAERDDSRIPSLSMFVHVLFGQRNHCRVSLLPTRNADLGEQIGVSGPDGGEIWYACQDEWYSILVMLSFGLSPSDVSYPLTEKLTTSGSLPSTL